MLETMAQLQELVRSGEQNWSQYGDVYTVRHDGMLLFNYGAAAQYANRWNWFERVSRGLILDETTGEVIARPFNKFFSWDSHHTTDAELVEVTEKLDGSLAILSRWKGKYQITTTGAFDSEQALWATEYWNRLYYNAHRYLDDDLTLLFEIIYPENRIVVDYGEREGLTLIGVRNRHTGRDFFVNEWPVGYSCVVPSAVKDIYKVLAMAKAIDGTKQEGYVCRFADGQRFKVKGEHYLFLHRLVTQASFKRVIKAMAAGNLDAMIEGVPDEMIGSVLAWRDLVADGVMEITQRVEAAFDKAPIGTRKEFALWVRAEHPDLMPYMFLRLDGRDYQQAIYRIAFKDDESQKRIKEVEGGGNQDCES